MLRQSLGGGGSGVFMKAEVLVREATAGVSAAEASAPQHDTLCNQPSEGSRGPLISVGFPDWPSYLGSEATPSLHLRERRRCVSV